MVKGLANFKTHFAAHTNQYILIGGTACSVIMEKVGLEFRSTKDLDIVLYVEALTPSFVSLFWKFIEAGKYKHIQHSTGKKIFYRFSSPEHDDYPAMLELFSRPPLKVALHSNSKLTPIPIDEAVASLSAILLDEEYYQLIHIGKCEIDGLPVLQATYLIPFKARAFLDFSGRKALGEKIDEKDLRKHRNDVIRLSQLLTLSDRIPLSSTIHKDMSMFIRKLEHDDTIDCKSLGIKTQTYQKF